MNVGTKSILFGVHQFLWHPLTVARAWRYLYGRWPRAWEWVCIFCHDLGYWGKPNMDGEEGRTHPVRGARLAQKIVGWKWPQLSSAAFDVTIAHSSYYAEIHGLRTSKLYLADKVSILFDPGWLYLLRARATGEIREYVQNSPYRAGHGWNLDERESEQNWFVWYRNRVQHKAFVHFMAKYDTRDAEWRMQL